MQTALHSLATSADFDRMFEICMHAGDSAYIDELFLAKVLSPIDRTPTA